MFTFREQEGLPNLTWCLKFPADTFTEWKEKFTIYLWEGKNKVSYAKAKADEQRYIQDAYSRDDDVEMEDANGAVAEIDREYEEEEVLDVGDEEEEEESGMMMIWRSSMLLSGARMSISPWVSGATRRMSTEGT